jgi:hypothetical protein
MASKYRLEIEVVLGEENGTRPIEVARTAYNAHGGASALVDGEERAIPAAQFITCAEQALIELVAGNPLFEQAGIDVDRVSCRREEVTPQQLEEPEIPLEDELDEEDSGVYLCRWPNGDFSIVTADSKREAIIALDEWDAARPSWLIPMDTCMIDFRLNARGRIEFTQFGFETADFVWKSCYPALDEVLTRSDGDRSPRTIGEIKKAVKHERTRLRMHQPPAPSAPTEVGRELQRRLGAAGPVADHYVEQFATQLLKSSVGNKAKPS